MAHKKGQGSVKNGRDSISKRLGVKKFGDQSVVARQHHHPPAWHQVSARPQRRSRPRLHDLLARGRQGPLRPRRPPCERRSRRRRLSSPFCNTPARDRAPPARNCRGFLPRKPTAPASESLAPGRDRISVRSPRRGSREPLVLPPRSSSPTSRQRAFSPWQGIRDPNALRPSRSLPHEDDSRGGGGTRPPAPGSKGRFRRAGRIHAGHQDAPARGLSGRILNIHPPSCQRSGVSRHGVRHWRPGYPRRAAPSISSMRASTRGGSSARAASRPPERHGGEPPCTDSGSPSTNSTRGSSVNFPRD